ncbi:DUF2141 domain-containing protein [Polaribacter sp. PL03]|uniref:DUF2141 domain-containing protein n=1 Tax=Polaribacter sp. PL03 TaxID=3088353 RepID=UPI0029CB34FA|nr:DUF2141 domain-containing protein [Polaribacter sp. PL03]MDX6746200.1 DUF2141 domain-containing protein [Polaribacter sp. PL03]
MKLLLSIIVVAMLSITNSLTAQNNKITVTVVNATSDAGKIGYALYTKDNFMGIPVAGTNGKIVNGKSTIVFENIPAGEYAVICYHDKNNNDKMDFAKNRMPLEDYGASNNVMAFAPPTFENAKFVVKDKEVSLEIKF